MRPMFSPISHFIHKFQGKHDDLQVYTSKCSLFTVKCNEFWFFERIIAGIINIMN